MIGYYIHHQGVGHLTRAAAIAARLTMPVTALSSADLNNGVPFTDHIRLEMDTGTSRHNPTANGVFHWAPTHEHGLRSRMMRIAEWIAIARPRAVVVDVSVEVAAFVRLMGVPVIVVAMPGERADATHRFQYQMAEHVIAAWPKEIYDPKWLHDFGSKTTYVGGISRFDGRPGLLTDNPSADPRPRILVLSGAGGSKISSSDIESAAAQHDLFQWKALGGAGASWVEDPWPHLCDSDVIITHAGQNAIADVATAERPAIVISEARPFDEQVATARALSAHGLAVSVPRWPTADQWPHLLDEARARGGKRWEKWRTAGAADRAAAAIESVVEKLGASQ